MTDYKKMYFEMFNVITTTLNSLEDLASRLKDAQKKVENDFISTNTLETNENIIKIIKKDE